MEIVQVIVNGKESYDEIVKDEVAVDDVDR